MTSHRIPSLDGLRALSIALVIVGHYSQDFRDSAECGPAARTLLMFLGNSHMGVTTFFGISGFLITYLLVKERKQKAEISLSKFYQRRILRIFPAFYAFLAAMFCLRLIGRVEIPFSKLAAAASFTMNYKHIWTQTIDAGDWFLGHFWSLALEEQFYLFWPVTLAFAGDRRAKFVAVALIFSMPWIRVLTYFTWPEARGWLTAMVHTSADTLMFGCLGALLWDEPDFQRWLDRLDAWGAPLLAFVVGFIASPLLTLRFAGSYVVTVGLTLEALCIALVMFWLIRHSQTVIGTAFNHPWIAHIGVLSYSLYLWQQPFIGTKNHTWTGAFPINLACMVAAAEISYWAIERPFLALRGRRS